MARRTSAAPVSAALFVFWTLDAHAVLRHPRDEAELADLRATAPEAAQRLADAEAKFKLGQLREADSLLSAAAAQAPLNFMIARRHCQVLAELGERARAVKACNLALQSGHLAMDRLATVSALMTGPEPPTTSEVAQAATLATTAKNLSGQAFGDAALCEIAYRLGDPALLRDCTTELARVAPGGYLTRRFEQLLDRGLRYWVVWVLTGLASIVTALHASRGLRTRRRARVSGSAAAAAAALLALTGPGHAEPSAAPSASVAGATAPSASTAPLPALKQRGSHFQLSRFPIDYDQPENKIPTESERNKEPLDFGYFLQDLAAEGAYAERKGDYAEAVKYWRALAKAVPDVSSGFRRTCRAYEMLKDRAHGLDFCGRTLNLEGAELEDYVHYGSMMLMKLEPLDAAELSDFTNTIKHLREQPGDGARYVSETLTCELAVAQQDDKTLERCSQALEKLKPGETQTLAFEWSLAMFRHDYVAARELVARLKAAGYKPQLLANMEASMRAESRWWKPFTRDLRYQLGSVAVVMAAVLWLLARRRPGKLVPTPAS